MNEDGRPYEPSELDLWLDGRLSPERARDFERRMQRSPELAREVRQAQEIEKALARRFHAPVPTPVLPAPGVTGVTAAAPSPHASGMASSRPAWLSWAAGFLIAFGAGIWFAVQLLPKRSSPPHGALSLAAQECSLDEIFANAAAGDFAPQAALELSDPELLSTLGSPTCADSGELVVVGEWSDARMGESDLVMLRSGAEPVMLVVPSQDSDTADLCVTSQSSLSLFSGCWRGRRIYELSFLGESRVLNCVQALDVESRRF